MMAFSGQLVTLVTGFIGLFTRIGIVKLLAVKLTFQIFLYTVSGSRGMDFTVFACGKATNKRC